MRYFKYILFSLILSSPVLAYSQAADTTVITLQQAVDLALKNNLDVKKSELQLATAEVDKNQSKENLLPTLNGEVDHGFNNGRSLDPSTGNYLTQSLTFGNYSLNTDVTLFSGLQYLNKIKQASLAFQAGKMDLQQARDLVTINVITAYLQVLDNNELYNQLVNQVDVAKKQLDRLNILEKEGANKLPSDLPDLKGVYADNRVSLVNAKATLQTSKLNLLQILNIPFNPAIKFAPVSGQDIIKQTDSSDQIYQTALAQLAYVKAATLRRMSAEKGVKAAKGALYPTLFLFGNINTVYSSAATYPNGSNIAYYDQFKNNYGTQFGAGIRIPILNYFQNRNKVALAKLDLLNYTYVEETTKVQLRQNVEQAYLNLTSAYERYATLQEQVAAYAESFRIAEIRFNAGVLNSVEFVLAKNNLDRADLSLINARYDCYSYSKILDYYQGKLSL